MKASFKQIHKELHVSSVYLERCNMGPAAYTFLQTVIQMNYSGSSVASYANFAILLFSLEISTFIAHIGELATVRCSRPKKIKCFTTANNLLLLNDGQATYFRLLHNTETAIDLSLCCPVLGTWFDCSVDCDIYL